MRVEQAGVLHDGRVVHGVTLQGGDMVARVLTLGATVQDLRLTGVDHPLVLGLSEVDDYLTPGAGYMGSIVGRVANRIGGAGFTLDGQDYSTDPNFRDRHTLHGGRRGTNSHIWTVEDGAADHVILTLRLPEGQMGFPGNLDIRARIAIIDEALDLTLTATTDAATPCNLAHHGYFDLDGRGDVRNHRLWVNADRYLAVDDDLIPLPGIAAVMGTPLDFRRSRKVGSTPLDTAFCLNDPGPDRPVARLTGTSGLSMTIFTDAAGLQVYDGAMLEAVRHGPYAGMALETQGWPDAPNRPDFPDCILRPGQIYRHHARYAFTRAAA